MRSSIRSPAAWLLAVTALGLLAGGAVAQEVRPGDCAALEDLKIGDT